MEKQTVRKKIRKFEILFDDTWSIFIKAPLIFIIFPIIIFFPFDMLTEFIMQNTKGDIYREFRVYLQVTGLIELFVGSWTSCVMITTIKNVSKNQQISFINTIREGNKHYGNVVGAVFSAGWRITIGYFLLIIPGIILNIKYALTTPIAVFENLTRTDATNKSQRIMVGQNLNFLSYFLIALLIYLPGSFGLMLLKPDENSIFIEAVFAIPFNILNSLLLIGLVYIYADLSGEIGLNNSSNLSDNDPLKSDYSEAKNKILKAVLISVSMLLIGWFYFNNYI